MFEGNDVDSENSETQSVVKTAEREWIWAWKVEVEEDDNDGTNSGGRFANIELHFFFARVAIPVSPPSNTSRASLTLLERKGEPPRSGWFFFMR